MFGLRVFDDVDQQLARHPVKNDADGVIRRVVFLLPPRRNAPHYTARRQQLISERLQSRRDAHFKQDRRAQLEYQLTALRDHPLRSVYGPIQDRFGGIRIVVIFFKLAQVKQQRKQRVADAVMQVGRDLASRSLFADREFGRKFAQHRLVFDQFFLFVLKFRL